VQLPVNIDFAALYVAVTGVVMAKVASAETVPPVMVVTNGLPPVAVPVPIGADLVEAVVAGTVAAPVGEPPMRTRLERETGEQPTNPGAVSLTDAHSSWLKVIASGCKLDPSDRTAPVYSLC
jgi:hypothetical protein